MAGRKKTNGKEVAVAQPNYLKSVDKSELGLDSFDQEDVTIPRIKMAQALTQTKDENKDINNGDYFVTVTKECLGNKMVFYVLGHWRSTVWFVDGKPVAHEHRDPATGEWVIDGSDAQKILSEGRGALGDKAETNFQNYMIVLWRDVRDAIKSGSKPQMYIWSCQNAAIKYAKGLNAKMMMNGQKGIPLYVQPIQASSKSETFKGNQAAYMPTFTFPNKLATDEEFPILKELFEDAKAFLKQSAVQKASGEDDEISIPSNADKKESTESPPADGDDDNPFA